MTGRISASRRHHEKEACDERAVSRGLIDQPVAVIVDSFRDIIGVRVLIDEVEPTRCDVRCEERVRGVDAGIEHGDAHAESGGDLMRLRQRLLVARILVVVSRAAADIRDEETAGSPFARLPFIVGLAPDPPGGRVGVAGLGPRVLIRLIRREFEQMNVAAGDRAQRRRAELRVEVVDVEAGLEPHHDLARDDRIEVLRRNGTGEGRKSDDGKRKQTHYSHVAPTRTKGAQWAGCGWSPMVSS